MKLRKDGKPDRRSLIDKSHRKEAQLKKGVCVISQAQAKELLLKIQSKKHEG